MTASNQARNGSLPFAGRSADEILEALQHMRDSDVRWQDGRAFSLVYDGGPGVHDVAERAAMLFLHDNALNPYAIPSLKRIERDVVEWTAALLHGGADAGADGGSGPDVAAGFMTSGGTESIQCAVLAARDRARAERGIERAEIIVAESAHAAFHKSAHMYDMVIHTAPVGDDWRADVDAMAELVNPNTALIVGSAMQYPQGVIDPIPQIAELARAAGAHCHVDACMGGFFLPFVEMLPPERGGREVSLWDFRVAGVDSISADVHKLGYAPKGASVVVYRNKALRSYQTFTFDGWLGGFYGSPNLQGSRPGLPMAAAWAVMSYLGVDGYLERTEVTLAAADKVREAIEGTDGVRILGDGRFHLVTITTDDEVNVPVDVFAVGDELGRRGWAVDRQSPPDSLHLTVSYGNAAVIDEFIETFREVVSVVAGVAVDDRSTRYSAIE